MGTARVHGWSVKRKLRTESFCGAKKSANTVYESWWGMSAVVAMLDLSAVLFTVCSRSGICL